MNGQYLCNRQITVSYAYKKDTKGERHGTPAGEPLSCNYLFSFGLVHAHCFSNVSGYFPYIMQKEFWLQVIQLHKRAGLILYLLVGLQHSQVLLRLMAPLLHQCLRAPLRMGLLHPPYVNHLRLKLHPSSLCRDNQHGINSSQVNYHHPQCLHLSTSSSGHLPLVCRCLHLHKVFQVLQGIFHHQQ